MSNILFRLILRPPGLAAGVIPRRNEPNWMTSKSFRISIFRAAQIFQTATSIARATKARGRISRVMQWLVLCGITYRGQGYLTDLNRPIEPASQRPFPHSRFRAGPTATGSSIASVQLSKNSTGYLCMQPAFILRSPRRCNFLRIATTRF
jgi:hypothetical protein